MISPFRSTHARAHVAKTERFRPLTLSTCDAGPDTRARHVPCPSWPTACCGRHGQLYEAGINQPGRSWEEGAAGSNSSLGGSVPSTFRGNRDAGGLLELFCSLIYDVVIHLVHSINSGSHIYFHCYYCIF